MKTNRVGTAVFISAALFASSAAAQTYDVDIDDDDGDVAVIGDEEDESMLSRYGVAVLAGGGVAGFTDADMRDTADVGGEWEVRAAIGTRSPIALEAGYVGTAQTLDAIGLDSDAVLVGTAVEGLARVNLLPREQINPYFFGGAAWRRYDVTNADTNTSDVTDSDNLLEIPVGVGVSYRMSGFVADLRGTFRIATEEDLIRTDAGEDDTPLHTWTASAKLGYEF